MVWAWGTTGHRVVVEIANNHLTNKAKRQISKIIDNQPLVYWANWPDFIKSNPAYKESDSWHYLNFPAGLSRETFQKELENSTDANLYKRTLKIIDDLKNHKNLPLEQKRENLYYLIHLLGDSHQPLHIGRAEDLGGNKFIVEWFKTPTNLHSLWDSKLIDFQMYSYSEYAYVLDYHDKKYNQTLLEGTFEDWLYDTYLKSELIYESAKPGEQLSYVYNYQYVSVLEEQLLKGGHRLAKILNSIFG